MKKVIFISFILFLSSFFAVSYAQDKKPKIILFIAEQNIVGPQRAWWATEIDLSTTETAIADRLIKNGYAVIEPFSAKKIIKQNKAFRNLGLSEGESIKLGDLAQADYVVLGKAIASSGSKVPQSNMLSCFANITAKLIRVKGSKVIAYLDASGNSAHMDVITGGTEALTNAAAVLSTKLTGALSKEGGR